MLGAQQHNLRPSTIHIIKKKKKILSCAWGAVWQSWEIIEYTRKYMNDESHYEFN